jgi:hypothetical protein
MTLTRLTFSAVLVGCTLLGLVASPGTARAEHASYCFTGQCIGFHGESHLIEALQQMDNALLADCEAGRVTAVLAGKSEILAAYREFCDPAARNQLLVALRSLNRYLGTRAQCDLDEAALAVTNAMDLERTIHAAVVVHHSGHPSNRPPHSIRPVLHGGPVVTNVVAKSYCYTGECFDFHGEAHIIEALRWMDQALLADCQLDRIRATDRARRQLLQAHQEFCDRDAQRAVLAAVRALNRYVGTRQVCDLDEAAGAALQALELERHVHVRPVGHHGGHVNRPPHGRQIQDFRSITLGNDKFRFRIGF